MGILRNGNHINEQEVSPESMEDVFHGTAELRWNQTDPSKIRTDSTPIPHPRKCPITFKNRDGFSDKI